MKEPSGLVEEELEGSVVVRKIRREVSRRVAWTWSVVCGVRASGRETCLGLRVSSVDTTPGAAASSPCWSGIVGPAMMGGNVTLRVR